MSNEDEISQIRSELESIKYQLGVLTRRLDVAETRKRSLMINVPPVPPKESEFFSVSDPALPPAHASSPTSKSIPITPDLPVSSMEISPSLPQTKPVAAASIIKPPPLPRREKKPRRFGPPEGMSFEMALGSYWLPRVGMLLVAIGTVWGFTYVAQQFKNASWMPYARVDLGYLIFL